MSESDPIRVFVAHAFSEHVDYLRVFEYLESRETFYYRTTSNPDPALAGAGPEAAREELGRQIRAAEVMVLPVAMLEEKPAIIGYQMEVARASQIPIVAVKAFGGTVAIQKAVLDRAADIVDWNDRALAESIRRCARGEGEAKWETIEFKLD